MCFAALHKTHARAVCTDKTSTDKTSCHVLAGSVVVLTSTPRTSVFMVARILLTTSPESCIMCLHGCSMLARISMQVWS